MDEQIAYLEELVAIDGDIRGLTEQIDKERAERGETSAERDGLKERIETDQASLTEMDKTRVDLVQELREMDKQIARSRERLQRARNEREVNAAERELDELRKLQRDRDDEIKRIVTLAEQARVAIQDNAEREAELSADLEGSLEGVTRTLSELEQKLAKCEAERQRVVRKLDPRTMRRYDFVKSRRAIVPVAKTHDGVCQGCHIQLPPMMFHEMLARDRFRECPFCHRIIYYAPPPPQQDEEAKSEKA